MCLVGMMLKFERSHSSRQIWRNEESLRLSSFYHTSKALGQIESLGPCVKGLLSLSPGEAIIQDPEGI